MMCNKKVNGLFAMLTKLQLSTTNKAATIYANKATIYANKAATIYSKTNYVM